LYEKLIVLKKLISSKNNVLSDQVTDATLFPSDLFQRWAKTDFANLRVSQSHITHTIYAFSLFFFQPNARY